VREQERDRRDQKVNLLKMGGCNYGSQTSS
jgi:hypothetical protein